MKILLTVILCILGLIMVQAQSGSSVKELERRLSDLEKRVQYLETKLNSSPPSTTSQNATKWKNTDLWRKLRKGMSAGQVKELLGEPKKIDGGYLSYWFYTNSRVAAHVIFDDNEKVYGWVEPD